MLTLTWYSWLETWLQFEIDVSKGFDFFLLLNICIFPDTSDTWEVTYYLNMTEWFPVRCAQIWQPTRHRPAESKAGGSCCGRTSPNISIIFPSEAERKLFVPSIFSVKTTPNTLSVYHSQKTACVSIVFMSIATMWAQCQSFVSVL